MLRLILVACMLAGCGGSGYGDNKQGTTTVEPMKSTGGLEQGDHK